MALEVGSVFARLGARLDDSGFDRFDRRLDASRRDSKRDVEANLKADLKPAGFDRFDRLIGTARRDASRDVEANLKADVDTAGFKRFNGELDKAERNTTRSGGRMKGAFVALGPAAGAAAVAGGAAAGILAKRFVDSASNIEESTSKIKTVLGSAGDELFKFSDTSAKAFGISKEAALEATGTLGALFKNFGQTSKEAAASSVQFTKLAADMASFNNTTPEEAIEALGAGLRGEAEPLRRYGVLLDDATLRAAALKKGLISSTKEALTPSNKALAAQAVILQQTKTQQGDFARTSGGLANQQRILTARVKDAGAELGTKLLPVALKVVGGLNKLIDSFKGGDKQASGFARTARRVVDAIRDVSRWVGTAARDFLEFVRTNETVQRIVSQVRRTLERLGGFLKELGRDARRTFRGITDDVRPIGAAVGKVMARIEDTIQPIIRSVLPGLGKAFEGVFTVIRGVVRLISGIITGDFDKAWQGAKDIVGGAIKAIIGIIRGAFGGIKSAGAGLIDAIGDGIKSSIGTVLSLATGFINGIISVINKLPGVNIGTISAPNIDTGRKAGGEGGRHYATGGIFERLGGIVTEPTVIVGEEGPTHPEVIIPSNPAYRSRAIGLWQQAGQILGVLPGGAGSGARIPEAPHSEGAFGLGGILKGAGSSVVKLGASVFKGAKGLASGLKNLLPDNPIPEPFRGMGDYLLDEAGDYITDKATSAFKALTKPFRDAAAARRSAGGGGAGADGLVAQVLRAIAWARSHGWAGGITSGFRSRAEQERLYAMYLNGTGNLAARPGTSNHEGGQAIDVSDTEGFARAMANAPADSRLRRGVPGEPWHFSVTGNRYGARVGPNAGGPRVFIAGEGNRDEWVISQEGDRNANVRWAREALETLTGRNVELHRAGKGRKRTARPTLSAGDNAGIKASVQRGNAGIGGFERQIQDLEHNYSIANRQASLDDDDYLIENEDGSTTVNEAAFRDRAGELDGLLRLRKAIKAKIEEYRAAITRAIAAYTDAINRLKTALAAAGASKSRSGERAGYSQRIADYSQRVGELADTDNSLRYDVDNAAVDLDELQGEIAAIRGSDGRALGARAAAAAAADPGDTAAGATSDAPSAADTPEPVQLPPSPDQIASAAIAQVSAFNDQRTNLFGSFGGNSVAAGRSLFPGDLGAAAGTRYFGAASGGSGRVLEGGGGIVQNISFAGPQPADPHTFTQAALHELAAAI